MKRKVSITDDGITIESDNVIMSISNDDLARFNAQTNGGHVEFVAITDQTKWRDYKSMIIDGRRFSKTEITLAVRAHLKGKPLSFHERV